MGEFDLEAFKASFASDKNAAVNDDLWKIFEETDAWSLWRCVYDYAEDNESVDATKEIVTSFMKNTESVKGQMYVKCDILCVMCGKIILCSVSHADGRCCCSSCLFELPVL